MARCLAAMLLVLAAGPTACGRLDFAPLEQTGPSFAIVEVAPRWAMPGGGTITVTLDGDAGGTTVSLDGAPCETSSTAGTSITCTAPPHAPATVTLAVTGRGGTATTRFVYLTPGDYQLGGPLDDRSSGIAIDLDGNVFVSGGTTGSLDGANQGDFDAVAIKYDASGRLAWIRQLGGPGFDYARDVAVDPAGEVTITGYTASSLGGPNQGSNDVFVARYAPDGTLQWVTQTGTAGDDQAWDLGVDDAGNTVVAIQTTGAFEAASAGGEDYAIARYTSAGALAWVHQGGTAATDDGHSVAVAPDGTAFLVGYTTGTLGPLANAGGVDLFVARYEVDGTRTWLRQRGGPGDDFAEDVAIDAQGDVWVAGNTTSALDGNPSGGGQDVFAMRFDAAGTWALTRQYGGAGGEATFGIAPSAAGVVYLECNTSAAFGGQPYQGGSSDVCVIALDRDGTTRWTRIVGGPTSDQASSCALDRSLTGFVYVSAITDGSLDGQPSRGSNDLAVLKLDDLGTVR